MTTPATDPATSATPATASSRPLSGTAIAIAILILLAVGLGIGLKKAETSSSSSWITSLFSSAPQPRGRCENAFALDKVGAYDFSKSWEDQVTISPGSKTELCYGTKVSIPGNLWKTWGGQFVEVPGQKDRCLAYFSYIYPDGHVENIGPLYGPKLELSDRSGVWRIATNCKIQYFRW
jgi:hypothetical protein